MSDPRHPGWEHTLDDVARSVGDCLAALDRHEATFAEVLTSKSTERMASRGCEPPGAVTPWDDLLTGAKQRAADVERALAAEEAEWARWRTDFADLRRRLQQPPGSDPREGGHGQGGGDTAGSG
ncbi:MAG: hypothetical protein ACRC7O_13640 [Fimbriiglobus sp.]